ncbi:MAG: hypothetical protein IRZ26_08995 [Clostridia bacterium]|nr:hypothetical protein [Clostridia bacterium]MCL6520850.1 hypothetical protein [Bacillota bacterium]
MGRWGVAALLLVVAGALVLAWGGQYEAAAGHWASRLYASPGSPQAARALAQMEIARIRYMTREVSTVALALAALWLLARAPAAWFGGLEARLGRWAEEARRAAAERRRLVRPGSRPD